jgi:hypothetical protein
VTISREQVADLQPGDVVEVHVAEWREGVVLRGPLHESATGSLWLADLQIRYHDGDVFGWSMGRRSTLTVVSRAPRPLYVNHDRTEPVPGDVVRDADSGDPTVWLCTNPTKGFDWWHRADEGFCHSEDLPARLRLLVDGSTGEVVP